MKTNDLIAMLATEASATPTVSPLRRCAQATAAGLLPALLLVGAGWRTPVSGHHVSRSAQPLSIAHTD